MVNHEYHLAINLVADFAAIQTAHGAPCHPIHLRYQPLGMTTLILEAEPMAASVRVAEADLVVQLTDGRTLLVPRHWYPRLAHATDAERRNWQLLGDGYAIEWPDVDDISV